MSFLELAHARYSCRSLSDKPVEDTLIEKLLEAARIAPTARNFQPWHLWLFRSPEAIEKLGTATPFLFGAKTALVMGTKRDDAWTRKFDGYNMAPVDAAIAGTHIILAAHDLGLGSTWVGVVDAPLLKKLYPEMEGYEIVGAFPIGYPAADAAPSPRHTERKSIDELVTRL